MTNPALNKRDYMKFVIEQQKHPPLMLLAMKNAYIRGGEDGLRAACRQLTPVELNGIAKWLSDIGSEFTVLSSLSLMAYEAAKQLCDRGEVYSIFDIDGKESVDEK